MHTFITLCNRTVATKKECNNDTKVALLVKCQQMLIKMRMVVRYL